LTSVRWKWFLTSVVIVVVVVGGGGGGGSSSSSKSGKSSNKDKTASMREMRNRYKLVGKPEETNVHVGG
jgi:hypothetical protein